MKNITDFILEAKEDTKLTFNNQLQFGRWFKKIASDHFNDKKVKYNVYFDDVDCVDPNDDSTIQGVKCDNTLTWGEASEKLIEYFKKYFDK